jgi:hypothetical protein
MKKSTQTKHSSLVGESCFARVDDPEPIELRSECDFYGASRLVASATPGVTPQMLKGFWFHGWQYNPPSFPELYRWHEAPKHWPVLVHRKEEEVALRDFGLRNVHAVGAPILYCSSPTNTKLSNSLLIMPFHSLDYVQFSYNEAEYFHDLDNILCEFDTVAACVHPSCLASGRWVAGFEERGIRYFLGARADDGRGLLRMTQMLGQFTHVTSNWIGSHLVYAALCGSAPSIYGPRPYISKEMFSRDPYYIKYPHILKWLLKVENSDYSRNKYAFLFRNPHEAEPCVNWALRSLGYENKRRATDVASLLSMHEYRNRTAASIKARLSKVVEKIKGSFGSVRNLTSFSDET